MTQTKIQGKFYPLITDELIYLCSVLTDAEVKTLLYLKTIHPFTDSYKEIDTAVIAEHLNVTRRSVQRFLKKLKELGLIEYEITKFKYRTIQLESDPRIAKRQQDRQSDPRIAEATVGSPKRQQDRQQPLEPLPDKDSETPQIIQTFQTPQTVGEEKNFSEIATRKLNSEIINREINDESFLSEQGENTLPEVPAKEKVAPCVVQNNTESNKLTPELIASLEAFNIPLDGAVSKAITHHHSSQVWGAIRHIENTWQSIENPRAIFLYQVPKQPIEKPLKNPLTPEFLSWYNEAINKGLVKNISPEILPLNQFREPKVYLPDDRLEDWQKVAAGEVEPLANPEQMADFFKKAAQLRGTKHPSESSFRIILPRMDG